MAHARSGIGAAIARRLGELGANLLLGFTADSSRQAAEAICEEFSSKYGSVCKAVQANLETPRPAAQKIVSEAKRLFANKDGQLRIDILINNAGIGGNYVIGEIPEEAFHKQYAVNVLAPLMLTQ